MYNRGKNRQIAKTIDKHIRNAFFKTFVNMTKNFQTKTIFIKTHYQFNKIYIDQQNKFGNEKTAFKNFAKKHVMMKKFIKIMNQINIHL